MHDIRNVIKTYKLLDTLRLERKIPQSIRDKIIEIIWNNPKVTQMNWLLFLVLPQMELNIIFKMTAEGIIISHGSARSAYWEVAINKRIKDY